MRIEVRVTPHAKRREVTAQSDGRLLVAITEPAEDGRANAAAIALLAEHFGVPRRQVTIVRGFTARRKLIDISL